MFMRDVAPFALAAAGVMAATHLATAWIASLALLLTARVAMAAALYYAVMRLARVHIMKECEQFLSSKILNRKQ